MKDRPLLFCLTCTRNYGWCTRAFLEANTRWADYVVVVDQMSTDGTREMAAEYSNVILIDDNNKTYSETRRSLLLLDYARSIPGDKILVALAIDEVFPANFQTTKDWQRVIQSKPGDVFCINWANIVSGGKQFFKEKGDMFRIFHDDGLTSFDNQNKDMHTHCLPYPNNGTDYVIEDFPILHFGHYNVQWNYVKNKYYQMVDYDKNHRSIMTLARFYADKKYCNHNRVLHDIQKEWLFDDFDLIGLVDVSAKPTLCEDMQNFITQNGIEHYQHLNIWQPQILKYLGVNDPRKWYDKLLHWYIDITQPISRNILIRAIDKALKYLM